MKHLIPKTKLLIFVCLLITTFSGTIARASLNQQVKPGQIRIHYHKADGNYSNLGLWIWDDFRQPSSQWPSGAIPFSSKDSFGAFLDLSIIENAKQLSFMVVNRTNGEKEFGNKVFSMNKTNNELWVKENDDKVYETSDLQASCNLVSAHISDENEIRLSFSSNVRGIQADLKTSVVIKDSSGNHIEIEQFEIQQNCASIFCKIDLSKTPLSVSFAEKSFPCKETWQLIDKLYAYDGDYLGCFFNGQVATLKLWAPRAAKVEILVFDKKKQTNLIGKKVLSKEEKGIWTCELKPDDFPNLEELKGHYYQYEVTNYNEPAKRVLDPYARSMAPVTISATGEKPGASNDFVGKAAFIDLSTTGHTPQSVTIENYAKREDAVIYEIHVRDFTSDPTIAENLEARWGTFAAFKSRLSYIKSLGVTHIQLLPVMAWYFGDETAMKEREMEYSARNNHYNWGYDPHNYFSPDGAYSQHPENAESRVAEMKELVDNIHQAGMGVILDVVYTHMAKADFLENIVPDYYFFKDPNGNFLGDFGNNLATNRKMSQKLIIDSVKHWFSIYKIDGMRWDMMGDATYESVQNAFDAAAAINPHALFIGEGWRTFKGHLEDPALEGKGATQDWMDKTDSVGVFSDEIRNELKSGFGCEGEPMFLTGGKRSIKKIFNNIKAQPRNTPTTAPGDMVQYIAAHDNLPLYDVIAQSIKKDPEIPANDLEIHQRIRIGNAIILTAQGTAFIHAGQEYGRTKQWTASGKPEHKFHELFNADGTSFKHPYFVHDSYDSSDSINMFDWKKATDASAYPVNVTTREFTSGLVRLRRSSDAFRLESKELVNSNVSLIPAPEIAEEDLVIAYKCRSTDRQQFHVFINADHKSRNLTLQEDLTHAEVVVDKEMAGTAPLARPNGFKLSPDSLELDPLTVVIFRSKR